MTETLSDMAKEVYPHNCNAATSSRLCSSVQALQQPAYAAALQQPAGTAATCMHCSSLKALLQPDGTAATCMHCSSLNVLQQPNGTAAACMHFSSLQALQLSAGTADFSDLGPLKQKMPQKCITFESKLRFTKFKGLNRSEFHQKLEFSSTFSIFAKKGGGPVVCTII